MDWHHHQRAQLIYVERGLLTTRTSHGTWSLAPGSAGWTPPLEPHTVTLDGPLRGWGMALAAPATPARRPVLGLPSWRRRWPSASANGRWAMTPRPSASTSSRCCWTRSAPRQRMHLPMPRPAPAEDRLAAAGRPVRRAAWPNGPTGPACRRSLTRHFRDETTLSFAQWRQARLSEALRQLTEGRSVAGSPRTGLQQRQRVRHRVPPSLRVAAWALPGAGRAWPETGLDPARGLASPRIRIITELRAATPSPPPDIGNNMTELARPVFHSSNNCRCAYAERAYLDYSMYVVLDALPVHRRRPEAGAAPHHLFDERAGPECRVQAEEVRAHRRRRHR